MVPNNSVWIYEIEKNSKIVPLTAEKKHKNDNKYLTFITLDIAIIISII